MLLCVAALGACSDTLEPDRRQEIIVSDIAPATPDDPRNTEGDVIVLADGRLLAVWSDFYGGSRDHSAGRISAKTSADGGRTWSDRFTVQENIGAENVISASLLRSHLSGDILLFFGVKNSRSDLHFFVRRSRDEGETWSEAVQVDDEPGYAVMNNDRVLQLEDGRLLAPVSYTPEVFAPDMAFETVVYYSDDDGLRWTRSSSRLEAPLRGAMEPGVVELADGRILQIIRTQTGKIWHSHSADRGLTWSPAEAWTVTSPEAPATIVRLPDRRLALFYNPNYVEGAALGGPRTPLVVALSSDEGASWSEPLVVEDDIARSFSYISATPHQDRLLLTYGVGRDGLFDLRFRSIPLSWFE